MAALILQNEKVAKRSDAGSCSKRDRGVRISTLEASHRIHVSREKKQGMLEINNRALHVYEQDIVYQLEES